MRMLTWYALAFATAMPAGVSAADRPIVVELFTSEGCSSCPPADAVLTQIARHRPDVLALGFHVTYWNNLGWPDPFSLQPATDRQSSYAAKRNDSTVFTPNLVVDGGESLVGADRAEALAGIRRAQARAVTAASIRATAVGEGLRVEVGAGQGRGTLVLVGFDPEHRTAVARGENRGRTLIESNVVRSIRTIATWTGAPLSCRCLDLPPVIPAPCCCRPRPARSSGLPAWRGARPERRHAGPGGGRHGRAAGGLRRTAREADCGRIGGD